MQSGQGFAFGKTLVTRHLARLHFTQSRLILNQPSQDAKAGLIYKKSHRVRGAAAPRKRSNPFFTAACTPQKTLCVEQALAQRNWPRQTRRLMSGQRVHFLRCAHKNARFGVKSYLLKRATPFLAKSVVDPPAARNRLARAVVDPRDRGGCVAAADMPA